MTPLPSPFPSGAAAGLHSRLIVQTLEGSPSRHDADTDPRHVDLSTTSNADAEEWHQTLRRATKGLVPEQVDLSAEGGEAGIAQGVPDVELTEGETEDYLRELQELRKDKSIFVLIQKEMKRRQTQAQDAGTREKYTSLLADLTRLLLMFNVSKKAKVVQVPIDHSHLLSWGKVRIRGCASLGGQSWGGSKYSARHMLHPLTHTGARAFLRRR